MFLKRKIIFLLISILFALNTKAAVFDYRFAYGMNEPDNSTKNYQSVGMYIYSYFKKTDFCYGYSLNYDKLEVEEGDKEDIITNNLFIGYDFSRHVHAEIGGGYNILLHKQNDSYTTGGNLETSILYQVVNMGTPEAWQIGLKVKYLSFSKTDTLQDSKNTTVSLFIGIGF